MTNKMQNNHVSLFQNKYRIQTIRLQNWDYTQTGYYFITICTKNREPYFGAIFNGEMTLSDMGKIVQQEWLKTGKLRNNIELDEYCIMPDHFHGIIRIINSSLSSVENGLPVDNGLSVETLRATSLRSRQSEQSGQYPSQQYQNISPKSGALSAIIRSFKSAVTKNINEQYPKNYFTWQPRYYDHIIRTNNDLYRIRQYIKQNAIHHYQNQEENCYASI